MIDMPPCSSRNFNPRAPCGARHDQRGVNIFFDIFQSTRPLRGATKREKLPEGMTVFQSTRPLRGATPKGTIPRQAKIISIHAPLAGRDLSFRQLLSLRGISIHAPLAGRDDINIVVQSVLDGFQSTRPLRGATASRRSLSPRWSCYFNPRAPCGARLRLCCNQWAEIQFQSTRPLRGATTRPARKTDILLFQSTRPLRGATRALSYCNVSDFNPRAPCGARRPLFP